MLPDFLQALTAARQQQSQAPQPSPVQSQAVEPNTEPDEQDNQPDNGNDNGGDNSPDPRALHAQAMVHLQKARQLYEDQVAKTPPHPERHKVGLGILAASLAAAALDPTHQFGASLYESAKGGQQQKDQDAYDERMNAFNAAKDKQLGESNFENQNAAQLENQVNDIADAKDKEETLKEKKAQFDENQLYKNAVLDNSARQKKASLLATNTYHHLNSMDSANPHVAGIARDMLRKDLKENRDLFGDAGYDADKIEARLDEADKSPSAKQVLAGKKIAQADASIESTKASTRGKELANDFKKSMNPKQLKLADMKISKLASDMKISKQKAQIYVEKWDWAKKFQPIQIAKAEAQIYGIHARADRAAKSKTGLTADDHKYIKDASSTVTGVLKGIRAEMKDQEAIIKNNQILAMDKNNTDQVAAYNEALARKKELQKQYQHYTEQAIQIQRKLGVN